MNIEEIESTIKELEESDTTFNNCSKLASLYIVRDHYKTEKTPPASEVVEELRDILPQYRAYCKVKRQYQLKEVPKEKVISSMQFVCQEVKEFLQTLYSSTDMPEERTLLMEMMTEITF